MKFLRLFLIVIVSLSFTGCEKTTNQNNPTLIINTSAGPNPWTHLYFYNDPDNFQFVLLSDRTGDHVPGLYEKTVDKVNLMMPEFVMCVGDLIEGKTEDNDQLKAEWHQFDAIVNQLEMPFFYLPGNHDISNKTMAKFWKDRFGASYYHFIYKHTLFLCLNTEDQGIATNISDEQLDYFKNVILSNTDVRWTVVFLHKPMWTYPKKPGYDNFRKLQNLLADRPYTIFAGHKHRYGKDIINNKNYYILSTNKDGKQNIADCRIDHFMWVTMTDNGPRIANILVEGVLDDEPCPKSSQSGNDKSSY